MRCFDAIEPCEQFVKYVHVHNTRYRNDFGSFSFGSLSSWMKIEDVCNNSILSWWSVCGFGFQRSKTITTINGLRDPGKENVNKWYIITFCQSSASSSHFSPQLGFQNIYTLFAGQSFECLLVQRTESVLVSSI